jgi:hypothetical protein
MFGPIGTGVGALAGIAGGVLSGVLGSKDAKAEDAQRLAMAQTEAQENAVRRTAMEVTSRRQSMQNTRQAQYARSMALSTTTNQGAQFGSGLGGAIGSIFGQANTNQQSINQNLQLGEQMFNLTDQLDAEKRYLSKEQSNAASDQAMAKMVGGIGGSLGDLGKFGSSMSGLMKAYGS